MRAPRAPTIAHLALDPSVQPHPQRSAPLDRIDLAARRSDPPCTCCRPACTRAPVVRIHVPPLRERREDIPILLDHFLDSCSQQYQVARCEITPQAMDLLVEHRWPGKIRELRNVVEQLVV